jgi:hypothetical protein
VGDGHEGDTGVQADQSLVKQMEGAELEEHVGHSVVEKGK